MGKTGKFDELQPGAAGFNSNPPVKETVSLLASLNVIIVLASLYMHTHTHTRTHTRMLMHTHVCFCIYIYTHVYIHIHMHTHHKRIKPVVYERNTLVDVEMEKWRKR